jgi:hypothetical protein
VERVKCSSCQRVLTDKGLVISLVSNGAVYTANFHSECLRTLIGVVPERRLETAAFNSGWTQLGLPLLRDRQP